jgi:hypothetical protein
VEQDAAMTGRNLDIISLYPTNNLILGGNAQNAHSNGQKNTQNTHTGSTLLLF